MDDFLLGLTLCGVGVWLLYVAIFAPDDDEMWGG